MHRHDPRVLSVTLGMPFLMLGVEAGMRDHWPNDRMSRGHFPHMKDRYLW
jgi:hypothetical protein